MSGVNKRILVAGAIVLVALAALAMVYYSDYKSLTVTANQILSTSVSKQDVTMFAPGVAVDEDAGTITVTIDNTTGTFDTVTYRLIIDVPTLKMNSGNWGNIRSIAIAVYKGSDLKGFLTPWTPTLVIEATKDPTDSTTVTDTYTLKLNGIAWKQASMDLGIRASVEIVSVTT